MRLRSLLIAVLLLLPPTSAAAQTVVLVQGYLGSGNDWRRAGIAAALYKAGWQDIGQLSLGPYGVTRLGVTDNHRKRFVTVALPTEAPVMVQADILAKYVGALQAAHPEDDVILVGHSAGGVVARAFMVKYRPPAVKALITIASPHLGTYLAEVGRAVGNSPLSWFAPFFGGSTVHRSQALYRDLSRENPGNLVGWLNRTAHPKAKYYAIIRAQDVRRPADGDAIANAYQQDLNQVAALRGRAKTIVTPGRHGLQPGDGPLIVNILREMGY